MSKLSDEKTMTCWKNLSGKMIDDFEEKGYTFSHIAGMHNITIAHKMDMSCDFYIKRNMHAVEWRLNALINKNKSLINNFPRNWRYPFNRSVENYRV